MPALPPDDDADRIAYTYRPRREAWVAWKDAVPRSTALYERLDRLLELDREHDLEALVAGDATPDGDPIDRADADRLADAIETLAAESDPDDVPLAALRIRRRCMSGVQNARAEGADDAAVALAEIQTLADDLLDSES